MKLILWILIPTLTWAQSVRVDEIKTDEDTTIEIKKGDRNKNERIYEITEGQDEIAGDPAPLLKDARIQWKKACEEWKKEMKELNKDNQILALSCGSMNCKNVAMEASCKSQAKYKLKVLVK